MHLSLINEEGNVVMGRYLEMLIKISKKGKCEKREREQHSVLVVSTAPVIVGGF